MNNLLKKYGFLMFLSVIIFALALNLSITSSIAETMEQNAQTIRNEINTYRVAEIKTKLNQMDNTLSSSAIPYPHKKDAKKIVIDTMELLSEMYQAKIKQDLAEKDSSYTADMDMTVLPDNPEMILRITDYFETATSPVIKINKISFNEINGQKSVTFGVSITQPFVGGSYVY